ncbi:MAG: sulfate permease [Actinobacteria bacterium]|jgi:high affinity sulfate transporter 1|nr:sulfate permease [Actinomycetota bacterium]
MSVEGLDRAPVRTPLLLPSLRGYRTAYAGRDVVAGLVLSALLVPQGMAYAELAGLPPVTGLYTSILCLVGYALVGPSRILVLGPDSSLGPMIAATILPLVAADGDPARAVLLASGLAIITGLVMVAAGLGHLGFVADLLSKPTILGYMNGLALTIIVGQLPKLLGFSVDAETFVQEVRAVVVGIVSGDILWPAAGIGLLSLAVLLVLNRWLPKVPSVLVSVVVAMALSIWLDLAARGVKTIGVLPEGLPSFTIPRVGVADLGVLLVGGLSIALVALADTISTATSFAARQGERVDGDREMIGIGTANIAAGLFQGFPVSTSGSRTAVAEQAGSRSQVSGLVGALMIAVMLVFVPGLLSSLPQPTLGAIVIAAAMSLADIPGTVRLYHQRRADFVLSMAAFLGVAFLGVLPGIVLAIALSVVNVFRRIWMPYRTELGRPEGVRGLHDVRMYPEAEHLPGCVILRFDAPLIFANAGTFRTTVLESLERDPRPSWVIIAAEPITDVDTTACDMLDDLVPELEEAGVHLVFAELKDGVRAKLRDFGLDDALGDERFFPTTHAAVDAFQEVDGTRWEPRPPEWARPDRE